ncbi:Gfo/Idh/MocA family protein [Sinomonas susongensis]|uniref:Gfo/Idh/MocA family protein n=1 Tax=Sinomonas susongensis TaxID=1324851 RepID=UPI001FE6BE37|nr:Gfo/Idh/MocA family oxidoreductase [Sinomonas susongensis]
MGVGGAAWRGQYFVRLIAQLPSLMECVGVVARRESVRQELAEKWNVAGFETTEQLLREGQPDFVVTSVSWGANPDIVEELVGRGVPVLSETPPAPDLAGLRELWRRVGGSGLVQVAEQYARMPTHAARLAAVRQGLLGEISSVQISSTHLYHSASLIRQYLDVGFEAATVSARRFTGPLVNPSDRSGWTHDPVPRMATTTIATLEFESGLSAVYDFTDNQSRNHLRSRRLLVRGSTGEINDDRLVRLVDSETILESRISRRQTGYELDHEGFDTAHLSLDGKVLWRNPFFGQRFNDEDIAMSSMLVAMAEWVGGTGPAPYPLAEAAQDHLLGLAIEQSADEERLVRTSVEAWTPLPR